MACSGSEADCARPQRQSGRSCFGPESNFEVQLLSEGAMIGSTMTDDRVEIVKQNRFLQVILRLSWPAAFWPAGPYEATASKALRLTRHRRPPLPHTPFDDQPPGHRARASADASTGGLASSSPRGRRRNKRGGLRFLKPGVRHLLHCEKAAYRPRHRWLYGRELIGIGRRK